MRGYGPRRALNGLGERGENQRPGELGDKPAELPASPAGSKPARAGQAAGMGERNQ